MPDFPLIFDYQSTTPCSKEVQEAMAPYWQEFWGNPASRQNRLGIHASAAVSLARDNFASYLKIKPDQLIFTSGATEANNLALIGHARARLIDEGSPGHIITLSTEHRAVLDPCRQLRNEGFKLTELEPDSNGLISIERLKSAFQNDTFLVSVMMANNEIGVIQPILDIALICKEHGIKFHTDASQALGIIPINAEKKMIDFFSLSGHKIYGPKGIGALIIPEEISISPLQWGGGQENGLRPGTLPVPLVIGFLKAFEIATEGYHFRNEKLRLLRDQLLNELQENIPDLLINGCMLNRLPNNLNITFQGIKSNRLHSSLRPYLTCSSGSACSNGLPSHVLMSIGRTIKQAEASIRLSLGRETNVEDIQMAVEVITKVVKELRI
tara:strand:- start:11686 stop:12834 length:1149 start_codon:yes stop_codon:yes gene_type:complete